jgi:crossover junction endodeoxyribonuclease RusA
MVTLELPYPPSVNHAYSNRRFGKGRGRIKSKAYSAWLKQADAWFLKQKAEKTIGTPIVGPYEAHMTFSQDKRRWNSDISNRIKVAEDYLKRGKLIEDDSKCERLTVAWGPCDGVFLRVFKYLDSSPSNNSRTT